MRAAKRFAWLLVPVVAAGGCGSKGKGADDGAAATSKAPLTKTAFDTDKEPAITAETRYAAGQLAETQSNPANAIKQYDEALRLKPDHVPSLYRLGVMYAQVKEYPKAIDAWKRYVKATHDSANGYGN